MKNGFVSLFEIKKRNQKLKQKSKSYAVFSESQLFQNFNLILFQKRSKQTHKAVLENLYK